MDDYNRGGHSKYSMKAHLIFVVKYRKKLFVTKQLIDDVKQFMYDEATKHGYKILEMEADRNHIHILLDYCPDVSISLIVKQLKQYSTYQMWKYHAWYLKQEFWKHQSLWSDGYFVCSIGQVSQSIIEQYIRNQG